MATFNPDVGGVPAPNMPDQTGASRGILPNRTFETLFEGIGTVVKGGAELMDKSIQNSIQRDAQEGFDAAMAPYDPDNLPLEVQTSQQTIQTLQTAFEQGKISDVYFYGQLTALSKNLRSKYPGYEPIVDETIRSVTGIRPANSFRDALLAELGANQTAAEKAAKEERDWIDQNAKYIEYAIPGFFSNPGAYDINHVRVEVAKAKAKDYDNEARQKEIARLDAEDNLTEEMATEGAAAKLGFIVQGFMNGTSTILGFDQKGIMKKIIDMQASGFTTEEYSGLMQQINSANAILRSSLQAALAEDIGEGKSYNMILGGDKTKLDNLVNQAMAPFTVIEDMLANKDYGLAAYYLNQNKLMQDQDLAMLLEDPDIRVSNALSEISPVLAERYLDQAGKSETIMSQVIPEMAARIATGQITAGDAIASIATTRKSAQEKAGGINTLINSGLDTITSGDGTPEEVRNWVKAIYSQDDEGATIWSYIKDSERAMFYRRMFHPDVINALVTSGDKASLEMVYTAARTELKALPEFSRAAAAVQDVEHWSDNFEVNFDPATGRLSVNVLKPTKGGSSLGSYDSTSIMIKPVQGAVDTLNSVFDTLSPIADGLGMSEEEKVKQYQDVMKELSIDLGAGRQENFFEWLGKQMGGVLGQVDDIQDELPDPNTPLSETAFNFEEVLAGDEEAILQAASSPFTGDWSRFKDADTPIEIASTFVGLNETKDRKVIAEFIKKAAGMDVDPAQTPWCASWINAVLQASGVNGNGQQTARSFLKWGTETTEPTQGDVVVLEGEDGPGGWMGHVGFFVGMEGDKIKVLGGNQGDSVAVDTFPATMVLGYRRPPKAPTKELDLAATGSNPTTR